MAEKNPPILINPIPAQIVNEGAIFGPLYLEDFIESPDAESGAIRFSAELDNGASLSQGLICTSDGVISGIAAANTHGIYEVLVTATNESGEALATQFTLTIQERIKLGDNRHFTQLKAQIWEALGQDTPLPEIEDLLNRAVTQQDLYYLFQRMATLTIWDVYNLDSPAECKLLHIKGTSKHYNIYDRGSCLTATPKDLYDYQRTPEDTLITAKAMAREVYARGWVIEFAAGFDKMVRACWVELQVLADKNKKPIQIINYSPSPKEIKLFEVESSLAGPGRKM